MPMEKDIFRVMVVSGGTKMAQLLKETLPAGQFMIMTNVTTMGEAKRRMMGTAYDIVIINTPLPDEFGAMSAIDMSEQYRCGILLFVKNEMFEQISSKVEDYGVLTIAKPTTKQAIYSAVKLLAATQMKLRRMEKEKLNLKNKMNEIQIIDRAKWLLVDQLKMSEPEAHRYIEKQAMDRCVKRVEIAQNILRTYEH